MRTATIYGLKTADSRVLYVGQTRQNPALRLEQHWKRTKTMPHLPISAWLLKVGREAVELVRLETDVTANTVLEREMYWTVELRTLVEDDGLNVRSGNTWHHGRTGTERSVEAMHAVVAEDPEAWRRSVSDGLRRHHDEHPETGAKISERNRRRYEDPAAREITAEATRRALADPAKRELMRARGKSKAATREGRAALSRAGKLGGAKGGAVSGHRRWHVARGITKPTCQLCVDEATQPPGA